MRAWLDNLKYQPAACLAFALMWAISLGMETRKR